MGEQLFLKATLLAMFLYLYNESHPFLMREHLEPEMYLRLFIVLCF